MSFTWHADKPLLTREQWMRVFIEVADELDMPDRRGACICAAMCAFQEAGGDPHKTGQRQIWIPGNNNDPAFRADPNRFRHDSLSNDGASTGAFQQQAGANWGWGGNLGDPEGTRKRMDPHESTRMFMGHAASGLKRKGYNASNAQAAGDSIQRVQGSSFPRAYDKWWDEANRLYDAVKGSPLPPPPPAPPAPSVARGWTGDPVWLADVLRAEGLKVTEHEGWLNRGRGDFKDIRGIVCHHTAGGGPNDWRIVQNGRPDLAGPLAQLVLERDGTYRVIAAGVCWHAGRGSWPGWPTNNANWHTIGIEAVNDGVGQPWPQVQLDAYKRGCAAIARRVGFGANMVVGHKEYSSEGKIDPFGIDMNAFRRDVAAMLSTPAPVGDDELSAEAERLIREMRNEIRELRAEWGPDKRGPSRSFMAEDGSPIESPLGFIYNMDGNLWSVVLTFAYLFHVPKAIEVVETIARNGAYEGSWVESEGFNAWLREFGQAYCQGLVEFKAALVAKLAPSAQASAARHAATDSPAAAPVVNPSAREIAGQLAAMLPAPDTSALQQAYEEIARLREENARLSAESSSAAVAIPAASADNPTLGQKVGEFVDAVDKLGLADSSDIRERAALAASIKVLSTKNGTEL